MAIARSHHTVEGIGESIQTVITPDDHGGAERVSLSVPDDATMLAVTVTDSGPDGLLRAARNVFVRLTRPDGTTEPTVQAPYGQTVIVINDPMPGVWRLEVEYGPDSSAEINVGTLRRGWLEKLRKWGNWFSCKSCKLVLRTLIIALLAHVSPVVAAGAVAGDIAGIINALPGALLAALKQTLALDADGLPKFVSLFTEYIGDPIDRHLTRACTWLRACPPKS